MNFSKKITPAYLWSIGAFLFFIAIVLFVFVYQPSSGTDELISTVQQTSEQQNLYTPGSDPLQPFLGSYTYTMVSGENEFSGTLDVRPMLDGNFIEWEFHTLGSSSWRLQLVSTWDKSAEHYRIWRFDTRGLVPPGDNEGTGHFSGDEFVMEWSLPAQGGEPWLLQNRAKMISNDTLVIVTKRERGEVQHQVISTARRISETNQSQSGQNRAQPPSRHVTTEELLSQPPRTPDHRIAYGVDSLNFGDLRIPDSEGPHPVGILIHGGCWLSMASVNQFDSFAEALTDQGLATWNISYRKVDEAGGGFPGTFLDVAAAVDHLRELDEDFNIDLEHVYLIGHSSGGHLATWAAARSRISETSPLYISDPLAIRGLVNIAGPVNIESLIPVDQGACGMDVIEPLMGGSPDEVPEHYAAGSPANLLPLGIRQLHLVGGDDEVLPFVREFATRAREAGDEVEIEVVPGAGHHDLIAPWSTVWPKVPEILDSFFRGGS